MSVFERLAKDFSVLYDKPNLEVFETQHVMRAAGRALYNAISKDKIYLEGSPSWFKRQPKKSRRKSNGTLITNDSWDLYWLGIISWLVRNRLDSGIVYSPAIRSFRFKKDLLGYSLKGYLTDIKDVPTKRLKIDCKRMVKASETTCRYLVEIIENPPSNSRKKKKEFRKKWKPPARYIGSKEITAYHKVPRTTLQTWEEKEPELKTEKDPCTGEKYYPKSWFKKKLKQWKPRKPECDNVTYENKFSVT